MSAHLATAVPAGPTCDDTLQRDLEVSNFVARATDVWQRSGRLHGVLLCSDCRNPYAVEVWPERRAYRVIETRCTCPPERREFVVVDEGDSDWACVNQCDDGIGHQYALVDGDWKCVHCGGLAQEVA